jgi:hypothetical protein
MQTVTLNMGIWLRRLVVRNSLVRVSDRIEAAAIFVGLASVLTLIENDQCCSSKVTTLACSG